MLFIEERPFLNNKTIGGRQPFFVIAGPCTLESASLAHEVAERMKAVCDRLGLHYIFKASFDKANRTSITSPRGPGWAKAAPIFEEIKARYGVNTLTDIHTPEQAVECAGTIDILQIPAFLCRQTDLVVAAARTDAWVNIKKGQFVAPTDAPSIVEKVRECGHERFFLTDRGASFGYHELVSDFRASEIIRQAGIPYIFDATHSVQSMGGGKTSGGQRHFAAVLARSAAAAGIEGLFLEVHPDPPSAMSDSATQLYLDDAEKLLEETAAVDRAVKGLTDWQPRR